jgi:predicted RNA-binding protein YlxR (DUF448 family)
MLRLFRSPNGEVRPGGEGRGAYLCRRPECLDGAQRGFARSFRAPVTISNETLDWIREWQRSESTR